MEITAKKLSDAQYAFMSLLQKEGRVKCTDRTYRTYKKLMEWELCEYHHDYMSVIPTKKGKELEL